MIQKTKTKTVRASLDNGVGRQRYEVYRCRYRAQIWYQCAFPTRKARLNHAIVMRYGLFGQRGHRIIFPVDFGMGIGRTVSISLMSCKE